MEQVIPNDNEDALKKARYDTKVYLLVHPFSYRYVKNTADYIYEKLREFTPGTVERIFCADVAQAEVTSGSIVFVIGDPFNIFTPRNDCFYVFMNFSLLYILGNPQHYNSPGYKWVEEKKKKFDRKLPCYNYILDYYASQTAVMREDIGTPVSTFPIYVAKPVAGRIRNPHHPDKIYDVCVVGTPSPRRTRLFEKLRKRGLSLSPMVGVILEDVIGESRIVLNMHAHESNHLELPRIVGALAQGATLVTEPCWGMDEYFPRDIYVEATEPALPDIIEQLLANPARLAEIGAKAQRYLNSEYYQRCELQWKKILSDIYAMNGRRKA